VTMIKSRIYMSYSSAMVARSSCACPRAVTPWAPRTCSRKAWRVASGRRQAPQRHGGTPRCDTPGR
jgi:hypothetical protein